MTADRIESEITIAAPIERVWAVLTDPEHVTTWFGTGRPMTIDLRPGGEMVLDHGVHGRYPTVIVAVDPPRRFSYRWAAGFPGVRADETNATLVEFTLESVDGGTRLRVCESGFAALAVPPEREQAAGFDSHAKGWPEVVGRLRDAAEGRALDPLADAR